MLYLKETHTTKIPTTSLSQGFDWLEPLFEGAPEGFNTDFEKWVEKQKDFWKSKGYNIEPDAGYEIWWTNQVSQHFGLYQDTLCKLHFVIANLALFKQKKSFSLAALEWAFDHTSEIISIKEYPKKSLDLLKTNKQDLDIHTSKFIYCYVKDNLAFHVTS